MLPPELQQEIVESRTGPARLGALGKHIRDLTPQNAEVKQFIAYLAAHHTVLDPTLTIFEGFFSGDPGGIAPGLAGVADQFPITVPRKYLSNALVPPPADQAAYREAFPALLNLLKALYDSGVTVIPGTDTVAGYSLLHELESYVKAGIPPAQVLRMATLMSAQVVGLGAERGVIAPGRVADMILVAGDPSVHIADLHHIVVVIKSGRIYDPARIKQALGVLPSRR